MNMINETHDVELQSWVASANDVSTDFPIQNLPFAAFRRLGVQEPSRGGVAIGDQIVDLRLLHQARLYEGLAAKALDAAAEGQLNYFMALGKGIWSALRLALSRSLRIGSADQAVLEACLVSQTDVEYVMPAYVGDYTDFYASIHHARNIGALFRPDNPLPPNYQWMPIGYHGRASSINVSGNNVVRPSGQIKAPDSDIPVHSVCKQLDYELEVGIFIGEGNEQGQPISIEKAEDHVFGLCVLNDWSARDIQAWEYQPLGPFLAKSFASELSGVNCKPRARRFRPETRSVTGN